MKEIEEFSCALENLKEIQKTFDDFYENFYESLESSIKEFEFIFFKKFKCTHEDFLEEEEWKEWESYNVR